MTSQTYGDAAATPSHSRHASAGGRPSASSGHAEYALLLTYIPSGMRVRATPAVRLATMTRDAANTAGMRRMLPVFRGPDAPPVPAQAQTRGISAASPAATAAAALVLELDVAQEQLMALTQMQPHLMQAYKHAASSSSGPGAPPLAVSALVSAADKSSFLELLIAQLSVHIGRGEQRELAFAPEPLPLPRPHGQYQHGEEGEYESNSGASSRYATPGASPHHGSSSSGRAAAAAAAVGAAGAAATPARRSSGRTGSGGALVAPGLGLGPGEGGARPGPGAGEEDGERFFNEMIPPEVALAARSETPLKPRSPHQRSRSQGVPSGSGSSRATAAATAASQGSTAPAAAASAAPGATSHRGSSGSSSSSQPQRFIFSPPRAPQSGGAASSDDSPLDAPTARSPPPAPAPAPGPMPAPSSPAQAHANVSALWAEVVSLRRENSDLHSRAHSLQTQLDTAAALEQSHGSEVRALRRALEESRGAQAQLEGQLALLRPQAQGKLAPRPHGAGLGAGPGAGPALTAEEQRDVVQSLQSELSHSNSLASSFAQSLASLQQQLRVMSASIQREFVATGPTLRLVHDLALRETSLAHKLSATSGAHSPSASGTPPIPPLSELDQSFGAEEELLASPEPGSRLDPTKSAPPSLQSLELLLGEGRAVERRFHFVIECAAQRNNLVRSCVLAVQTACAKVQGESLALLETAREMPMPPPQQQQLHPQVQALQQKLSERDTAFSELQSSLSAALARASASESSERALVSKRARVDAEQERTIEQLHGALQATTEKLAAVVGEKALAEAQRNTDLNAVRLEVSSLEEQLAERGARVASLQRQVALLQAAQAGAATTNGADEAQQQEEMESLRSELRSLRHSHTRSTTSLTELHAQLQSKVAELASLHREHSHLSHDNTRMESIITQAKEQTKLLSAKLAHFEDVTIPSLSAQNAALASQLDQARRETDRARSDKRASLDAQAQAEDARAKVETLERRERAAVARATELESALSSLRDSHSALQARLVELESERERLTGAHQTAQTQLGGSIDAAQERAHVLSMELAAARQENVVLGAHVEATKSNLAQLQAQHRELQDMHKKVLESRTAQRARSADAAATALLLSPSKAAAAAAATAGASDAVSDLAALIQDTYALKMNLLQQQQQQQVDGGDSGGAAGAKGENAKDSLVGRRLAQERDAALQQYELLRNGGELARAAAAQAEERATIELERAQSFEAQLVAAEPTIAQLQQRLSLSLHSAEQDVARIAALEKQVRSLEGQVDRATAAQASREESMAALVSEKNAAMHAASEARGELHAASLQVSEGLRLVHKLEDELESSRARSESARASHAAEVAEARADIQSLQAQLRSRDAQMGSQRAEMDRLRSALDAGSKRKEEFSSAVPALRRENRALEDALLKVGEGLRLFAADLQRTKRARREILRQFGSGGGDGDTEDGAMGQETDDGDGDTDDTAGEMEFDIEAHLSPLSPLSPRGSSAASAAAASSGTGREGEGDGGPLAASAHKYPSVLGLLLHDLGALLESHTRLLLAHRELQRVSSEREASARAAALRAQEEKEQLVRQLRTSERERAESLAAASKSSSSLQRAHASEMSEAHSQARQVQSRLDELQTVLERTVAERKEYAENYQAMLEAQRAWEKERTGMKQRVEEMEVESQRSLREHEERILEQEALSRQRVMACQAEVDAAKLEGTSLASRVAALQNEVVRAQAREKSYKEKDARAAELDAQKRGLEAANASLQSRLDEAQSELNNRQTELSEALDQSARLDQRVRDQTLSIQSLETRLSESGSKLSDVIAAREALESQLARTQTAHKESVAAREDVEGQLARAQSAHRDYVARMKEQWAEEEALRDTEQEEALRTLRASVKQAQQQHAEEQTQRAAADESLRTTRASLKQTQLALSASEARCAEQDDSLHSVRTALKQTQQSLAEESSRRAALEDELQALEAQRALVSSKLEQERRESAGAHEALQEKLKRISKEAEKNLRDAASAAREDAARYESAQRALEARLAKALGEAETAQGEVTTLEGQMDSLRLELRQAEAVVKDLHKSLASVERDRDSKADLLERATREVAHKVEQLQRVERDVLHKTEQLERASQNSAAKTEQLERCSRELAQRTEQLQRAEREVALKSDQLDRALHEASLATEQVERAQRDRVASESTLGERMRSTETQLRSAESLARSNAESLRVAEARVDELESERRGLLRTVQEEQGKNATIVAKLQGLERETLPRLERSLANHVQQASERSQEREVLAQRLAAMESSANSERTRFGSELSAARGEMARLEGELGAARNEAAALAARLKHESETGAQVRAAAQALERDNASRAAQWAAESQTRAGEFAALHAAHSSLQSEHDRAVERAANVASKLRELSGVHDELQAAHHRATQQLAQAEASLARAAESEANCRALHLGEWEPLLQRLTADLREHAELVTLLRGELSEAQKLCAQRSGEVDAMRAENARQEEEFQRSLRRLEEEHAATAEQMQQENAAQRAEFDEAHAATLDRLREVSSTLETRVAELERIRSLLGLEWLELARLSSDESGALRERARALFNVEASLSIVQLHALVKQQSLHLQDAKAENEDLNRVIVRLKEESMRFQQQKQTEHATMDTLLIANRRLQAFIDQQGQQEHGARPPSVMATSGVHATPAPPTTAMMAAAGGGGGAVRDSTPLVFSASRRTSISATVSPAYLSPQQQQQQPQQQPKDAPDASLSRPLPSPDVVPFDSTFAGAAP